MAMKYDFKRCGFGFRYFMDVDVDELCHQDDEGYEVFDDNNLVYVLRGVSERQIEDMSDEELMNLIYR